MLEWEQRELIDGPRFRSFYRDLYRQYPDIAPRSQYPAVAFRRHNRATGGRQILALLLATRPLSSLVAGALTASVLSAYGHITLRDVTAALAMTLLTMFGFVVNDLFDRHKDAAAGVRRPIATGELSIESAVFLALDLLVAVFFLSSFIGVGSGILLLTSVALFVYSLASREFPLCKGLYVAALACAPVLYGSVVGGVELPWISYATLSCFVFGRETLMDSDELDGDRLAGLETFATVLGSRHARQLGLALMFLAAAGVVVIAHGPIGRAIATVALLTLGAVFAWPGLSDSKRIQLSRFSMLLGAVAIAIAG